jgi:type I restriction enzyme R subunit
MPTRHDSAPAPSYHYGPNSGRTFRDTEGRGALFQNQESSNRLLKALLENETFADAVQKIISTETWRAARRKHGYRAV